MSSLLEQLRGMVATMPLGASVSLPVDWLREQLETAVPAGGSAAQVDRDLTVEEVGERVGRRASTVRGWCSDGLIPEAYKLQDRDWRVPPDALRTFLRGQKQRRRTPRPRLRNQDGDLGDWRKHVPKAS